MTGSDGLWIGVGLLAGGAVAALLARTALARVRAEGERDLAGLRERLGLREAQLEEGRAAAAQAARTLQEAQAEVQRLAAREAELTATLQAERQAAGEKRALLDQARATLSDAFRSLSADALQNNNQAFLALAGTSLEKFQETARSDLARRQQAIDEMVKPVRETLEKFDRRVGEIEQVRTEAYGRLCEQVAGLQGAQELLRKEAAHLAQALGAPQARGRWGELTLRRVVELAGMQSFCDFEEQVHLVSEEGRQRPDLVVRIPGGRSVAVDAKVPLQAYLEALQMTEEGARRARMADYARRVREHIKALSAKSYWERLTPAPEFVVLFLPGEPFYGAALDADPSLIEYGVDQKVILATPTTLIALLKAIAFGWRQEALAENAEKISELGRELYKRLADMTGHFEDLGERLQKATESYNKAIGSLDTRVLVSARRFVELHASTPGLELPQPEPVELLPRRPETRRLAEGE
jgi:DNA recombination protein RmuC